MKDKKKKRNILLFSFPVILIIFGLLLYFYLNKKCDNTLGCRGTKCTNAICKKCSNPDKNGKIKCSECVDAGYPDSSKTYSCIYSK